LFQLRVGVWAAGLRRQRYSPDSEVRGQSGESGVAGRNCAKGPATLNQSPILIDSYPLKRAGKRGEGKWERVGWDEVLDTVAARIRKAIVEDRRDEIMYHVGRPGEDGFTERILAAWAWTVTTRTPTFVHRVRAKVTSCGWVWIVPVPITRMRKSSC